MVNQYFRLPVPLEAPLRRMLGACNQARRDEIDLRAIDRMHRNAIRRRRLLDFKAKIDVKDRKVKIAESPCECGRNHYAITLNGNTFCPLTFWLNMCRLVRMQDGDRAMCAWHKAHPLRHYVKRVDLDLDATYRKELDYAATR